MVSIATNLSAQRAGRNLERAQTLVDRSLERLSTGLRLNHSADGPADFAIAERFKTRVQAFQTAQRNAETGVSMMQTADESIQSITESLQRIRTLALQSSSDTMTTSDRTALQAEVDGLLTEIDRVATSTEFNTINLLDGSLEEGTGNLNIQVGANGGETIQVNIDDMRTTALGVNALDVSTQGAASAAISTVDSAIDQTLASQSEVGTLQNRLESAATQLASQELGHEAARSVFADADIAAETTNLIRGQMLTDTSSAALVQANLQARNLSDTLVNNLLLNG